MDTEYTTRQQLLLAQLQDCFKTGGVQTTREALIRMGFSHPTMSHVIAVVPQGQRIRDGHEHLLGVLLYYRQDLLMFVSPPISPLYPSLLPGHTGLLIKKQANQFTCVSLDGKGNLFTLGCEDKDHNGRVTLADDTIYHVPILGWATLRHLLSDWTTHDL